MSVSCSRGILLFIVSGIKKICPKKVSPSKDRLSFRTDVLYLGNQCVRVFGHSTILCADIGTDLYSYAVSSL